MAKTKFDFSGWVTKNNVKCSDGRVIRQNAFEHCNGMKVPLIWQHFHNEPANVLGHAILENRKEGVYAYCKFNSTQAGKDSKELVEHGDINQLSIYANNLTQQGSSVMHGDIREVSLVISGANPEAMIDNLEIQHGNEWETDNGQAVIHSGTYVDSEEVEVDVDEPEDGEEDDESGLEHADETGLEVYNTLNTEQKELFHAIAAAALEKGKEDAVAEIPSSKKKEMKHSSEGGREVKHNVFEKKDEKVTKGGHLTHSQIQTIINDGPKYGTLKDSFLAHAAEYGIDNIEILFPDAKSTNNEPDVISRDMGWVPGVINGTRKSPFMKFKSFYADLTADEARAKGYITATQKIDEVFPVMARENDGCMVYKRQRIDRENVIKITDFQVIAFLKKEMRLMWNEEVARAILIGDGRLVSDKFKIKEDKIRPVYTDDEFYTTHISIPAGSSTADKIDAITRARSKYKGTGTPDFYTTADQVTEMLLLKDLNQRRIYATEAELCAALRVRSLIEVEVMEGLVRTDTKGVTQNCIGIMLNIYDYTVGTNQGGELAFFDDFNLDFNQYIYLMEAMMSGALTKHKSAVVIETPNASAG